MSDKDLVVQQTKLRQVDYTSLDYNTIQEELIEYAKISGSTKGLVDNYLEGDASRVIIDLFSYLGNLLTFRIDTLANEMYLPTAQRRKSIIDILDHVAQRPNNPTHSNLTLTAVISQNTGNPIQIPARFPVTATGLDGNQVQFEIMNEPTDYFTLVEIPGGVTNYDVPSFSGTYSSYNIISTGESGFEFTLPLYPVIEDSIKVSVTPVAITNLTSTIIESSRVREVESLVDASNEVFFRVRYDQDGRGILTFATEDFGIIPPAGNTIHVDYRIGGGANTNITSGSVNYSTTLYDTANNAIQIAFTNPTNNAVGGEDLEDLETVKLRSPALVRANENLVTTDDYEAIIGNLSGIQDVFAVDGYTDDTEYAGIFNVPDNSVFMWVLPETGGELSPDLRLNIEFELEKRRLTAIQNFVFSPIYNDWLLSVTVNVNKQYNINTVRTNIINALLDKFGTSVATFKNQVRTSVIISTIQAVEGVNYVTLLNPLSDIVAGDNEVLRLIEGNINLGLTQ